MLVVIALLVIASAFAACSLIMMSWFKSPSRLDAVMGSTPASRVEAENRLGVAREEFRAHLLNAHSHLRLSDALWRAARPVDSFYVMYAARQLFSEDSFRRAHAEVILGAGGPAAALRSRLQDRPDTALSVPVHAEVARKHPDTPEGRQSLNALSRLAAGDENASDGESARLARAVLEELHHDDPGHPGKLASLGMAFFARGDFALAYAVASEALAKNQNHAGAAQIMGALALQRKDMDGAMRWFSASWNRNPDDLYSASKLAQIYDKRRADAESALPFYLALYRQNPDFTDGGEPVERRIRGTLDVRRESLLKRAPVEGLGIRFALDDASLRAEACLRAAALKDPRWIDRLGELLDDDAEIVRRNADYALFKIGKKELDAVLLRRDAWLGSKKPLVRIRALNLYADLDGKSALPALATALRDPNPAVRAFAKVMVLDHYFAKLPEAAKLRTRYLAEERSPEALAFLARFSEK